MLDLIAAAGIGGITVGALVYLEMKERVGEVDFWRSFWRCRHDGTLKALDECVAAHTRCADALTTTQRKLSAIRDLVGPTEGLRRGRLGQIAAILDGERA